MYDHRDKTTFTSDDCFEAVGKKATLTLTGTITEARESCAGPFVMFLPDERWGLGKHSLGMDLDALTIEEMPR